MKDKPAPQDKAKEGPMRKSLLAGTMIGVLIGPAVAADIVPAVPADVAPFYRAPLPVWGWTGFYIGGNVGGILSSGNTITNTGTDTGTLGLGAMLSAGAIPGSVTLSQDGVIGGGQAGYNWQLGPSWVWGIEADVALTNAKNSTTAAFGGNAIFPATSTFYSRELDTLGTVRGRAGFLLLPNLMWYGTGGLAFAQTRVSSAFSCATCLPPSGLQGGTNNVSNYNPFGWTVGTGLEWQFTPAWSVKAEYLYVDLGHNGTSTVTYSYPLHSSSLTSTFSERDNIVRFGFNYRFY
jgi:outer membrane immunogenic protein